MKGAVASNIMANKPIKILGPVGAPNLIGHVKTVKDAVSVAITDIQNLSNALNQSVSEIEGILNEYPVNNSATLAVNSWNIDNNSTTGYRYYYDIYNENIDANDLPIVSVSLSSLDIATAAELCPVCQSLANTIRLYAKNIPTAPITVGYFIIQGQSAT